MIHGYIKLKKKKYVGCIGRDATLYFLGVIFSRRSIYRARFKTVMDSAGRNQVDQLFGWEHERAKGIAAYYKRT